MSLNLWPVIEHNANRFGLDPKMVDAVCAVESSHEPWATRYEPGWRWFADVDFHAGETRITKATERVQQATSWGLMQVMGAVSRELGYRGHLPGLCTPHWGLYYGCMKLQQLYEKHGSVMDALAAYNAGRPDSAHGIAYARKVSAIWQSI